MVAGFAMQQIRRGLRRRLDAEFGEQRAQRGARAFQLDRERLDFGAALRQFGAPGEKTGRALAPPRHLRGRAGLEAARGPQRSPLGRRLSGSGFARGDVRLGARDFLAARGEVFARRLQPRGARGVGQQRIGERVGGVRKRPHRLEPLAPLGGFAVQRRPQPLEADIATLARGVEVGAGGGLRVGGELGERRLARLQRAARVGESGLRGAARLGRLLVDADMLGRGSPRPAAAPSPARRYRRDWDRGAPPPRRAPAPRLRRPHARAAAGRRRRRHRASRRAGASAVPDRSPRRPSPAAADRAPRRRDRAGRSRRDASRPRADAPRSEPSPARSPGRPASPRARPRGRRGRAAAPIRPAFAFAASRASTRRGRSSAALRTAPSRSRKASMASPCASSAGSTSSAPISASSAASSAARRSSSALSLASSPSAARHSASALAGDGARSAKVSISSANAARRASLAWVRCARWHRASARPVS